MSDESHTDNAEMVERWKYGGESEDPMLDPMIDAEYKEPTLDPKTNNEISEIISCDGPKDPPRDEAGTSSPMKSENVGEIFLIDVDIPLAVLLDPKSRMKFIAKGSFGKVYGYPKDNPTKAIKISKSAMNVNDEATNRKALEQLRKEIDINIKLAHDNIARYLASYEINSRLYIIMEYVPGDLYHYLQEVNAGRSADRESALEDSKIKDIMKQLLNGLSYLHSKNILHRDLKSPNILISREDVIKIADFGMSKKIGQDEDVTTTFLSELNVNPLWQPPERIDMVKFERADRQNFGYDIWSLGVLFLEVNCARPPHFCLGGVVYAGKVFSHKYVPEIPAFIDDHIIRYMIERCLNYTIRERPSCLELLHYLETERPVERLLGSRENSRVSVKVEMSGKLGDTDKKEMLDSQATSAEVSKSIRERSKQREQQIARIRARQMGNPSQRNAGWTKLEDKLQRIREMRIAPGGESAPLKHQASDLWFSNHLTTAEKALPKHEQMQLVAARMQDKKTAAEEQALAALGEEDEA